MIVYVKNDEKNTGKLEKTFQSDYSKAMARKELKISNKKYKKIIFGRLFKLLLFDKTVNK